MRLRNAMRLAPSLGLITFTLLTASSHAFASEDADAARALFMEARRLASDGEYARACPLFEKSLKLEAGMGTQFNLADCWEHTGRMASAYEMFRRVASAAKDSAQPDRERVATQRAEALAPKLSRLQVKSDATVKTLRVSRAGVALGARDWKEPTPIDPGTYNVASLSGEIELWSTDVTVPEQGITVVVAIAKSDGKPVVTTQSPKANPPAHSDADTPKPQPEQVRTILPTTVREPAPYGNHESLWTTSGLLLGGAGVALGTVLTVLYESKNGEARDICPTNVECSDVDIQRHSSLVSDAKAARLGAALSFGVGAASFAAVGAYYIWKPKSREKPPNTALRLSPSIEAGGAGYFGATAQGSW